MAIAVKRDDRRRRVIAAADGIVKVRDILALMSKQRTGRFRSYALLFDMSAATLSLTGPDLAALAALADALRAQESERRPVALVARRPGAYALARMYASDGERRRFRLVRVFRTRSEAISWLTRAAA
jgi:hypothetical protein